MLKMRKTRPIWVGRVQIGGGAPIVVQSMTTTHPADIKATVTQIRQLEETGCEIIRIAVPDESAAQAIPKIKSQISIPLIADIHFDYRLAIKAIEMGADGIRINPGNIGGRENIRAIITLAKKHQTAIRIGVNSGSLEKEFLRQYGGPTPEAMVASALKNINLLEDLNFLNFKISLKSSNVLHTISAYRLLAQKVDYPFHLGVTEAGPPLRSAVKSAIALGTLLQEGIGETIRVSVTGDPVIEMKIAYEILRSLGLRSYGIDLISCPTCGRCQINLVELVEKVERALAGVKAPLKVAVMGCVVNGPGEAKEADIGIAGGKGVGILFKKGIVIRKVKEKDLVWVLAEEVKKMLNTR
ncbi:MAG: flavodoxin-dependent (E)-4-hydroxy-3-methylbut-2-enyl-diphosphate synthase [Candidatus Desulfofervidaceae bacterium]|nr:flavodoxin-dependent (E)-4-hydroxy-3-methylbut-2-enyl-diphosphate synthase [Candidatus Desulfofervidaceae bacterium]